MSDAPDTRPTWANIITILALLLAVGIIVAAVVLSANDHNGYGPRSMMHDLVLTLFALAVLLLARRSITRTVIGPHTHRQNVEPDIAPNPTTPRVR